ncbi:helix-turn-helix domain-containing protein [Solicola gregarius]|uniref:AraC family transcriptional regulator n=1 Tax=Solicola gregarius TaxID=2908642 RepID=A0AA46TH81_9ACTN|nr:AraC family transcriptional regulator [Solicola gregarius]UYM04789.1 AraC family transcriptional regulator [Solicola gregarius]
MPLDFDVRPSDSPYVECVWRTSSSDIDRFTSIASCHWSLVVCRQRGRTEVSVQGPETFGTVAPVPQDATFLGIRFRLGVVLHDLPVHRLVNGDLDLVSATAGAFWWKGTTWHLPSYENAEALVDRLVGEDLLAHDPLVDEVLRGGRPTVSARTVQRRFQARTGLTYASVRQIERARLAATRLRDGGRPADVAYELGYYDQPHLTRSLRAYIGRTPALLGDRSRSGPLSVLYKTVSESSPTLALDTLPELERRRDAQDHSGHDDHAERAVG